MQIFTCPVRPVKAHLKTRNIYIYIQEFKNKVISWINIVNRFVKYLFLFNPALSFFLLLLLNKHNLYLFIYLRWRWLHIFRRENVNKNSSYWTRWKQCMVTSLGSSSPHLSSSGRSPSLLCFKCHFVCYTRPGRSSDRYLAQRDIDFIIGCLIQSLLLDKNTPGFFGSVLSWGVLPEMSNE